MVYPFAISGPVASELSMCNRIRLRTFRLCFTLQCKGTCGVWLQGSEGSGEGTLALQPDYLLLDGAGRRHVLPARLALASAQDWWVPRSRVDLCVLTDALHFATQSQLWLLSNSPRPSVRSPDGDRLS